jgi:hypothetical protein
MRVIGLAVVLAVSLSLAPLAGEASCGTRRCGRPWEALNNGR